MVATMRVGPWWICLESPSISFVHCCTDQQLHEVAEPKCEGASRMEETMWRKVNGEYKCGVCWWVWKFGCGYPRFKWRIHSNVIFFFLPHVLDAQMADAYALKEGLRLVQQFHYAIGRLHGGGRSGERRRFLGISSSSNTWGMLYHAERIPNGNDWAFEFPMAKIEHCDREAN